MLEEAQHCGVEYLGIAKNFDLQTESPEVTDLTDIFATFRTDRLCIPSIWQHEMA